MTTTHSLTIEQTRLLRLRAQRLHPSAIADTGQLIRDLGGMQSQEWAAAKLAIRARTAGLTAADVRQAREEDRSIVLTWAMRGTMHLVAAEDAGWMLALFGPHFIRLGERRYRELGLDEDTRQKAAHLMREMLTDRGPLSRAEIAETLAADGIPVEGQAIAHLVRYAALEGVICFGPERDGKLTYVVLADWLSNKKPYSPKQPLGELARRYVQAYGPTRPDDFAIWSGLTIKQAREGFAALADDLIEVDMMGTAAWILKQSASWLNDLPDAPSVRLLPRYDNYLLGYSSRAWMVDSAYAKRIHPGGGQINQTVIVDGAAMGTWQHKPGRIMIEPFEPIKPELVPLIEAEQQDIGRFLQQT